MPDEFSDLFYGELAGVPIPILIAPLSVLCRTGCSPARCMGARSTSSAPTSERPTWRARPHGASGHDLRDRVAARRPRRHDADGLHGLGRASLGASLLLPSIAAAVIGGLSLQGGSGGVINALLGALFILGAPNGMNLIEVNGYLQDIVLGWSSRRPLPRPPAWPQRFPAKTHFQEPL